VPINTLIANQIYAVDAELIPKGDYDSEKERWISQPAPSASNIHIKLGSFAIFWPGEPHRPQIKALGSDDVVKVIFKINHNVLG
jgi:beta-galactosidase beta subunit